MLSVFVDEVSHLPESFEDYPDALPKRINPSGIGRNMTMYLVMKKLVFTLYNTERIWAAERFVPQA